MGMEVHLYGLDDEYIGSSDVEDPPPDFLEWNGRMFRKSMELATVDQTFGAR